jgi:hypothetical protein
MSHNARRQPGISDEHGTVLVVTVVAMLILGILAVSFAALGNLEVRIGLNDVWNKQAALIAEGGIAAVQSQIQNPPDYTAFLGHVYSCTTSSCTCTGAGCATSRLATMSTGEFSVRVDNDPDDPAPTVDTNKRVLLTALGITRGAGGGVMGRVRLQAWLTNDDPWKHVCSSGDGVLCTDPPNNPNAEITPSDPNHPNGPRTYPEIPVPNQIRCTPVPGGDPAALGSNEYPVPTGLTNAQVPSTPRGPCVIYPYYLTALQTPCPMCIPAKAAYHSVSCNNTDMCLGMVRFDSVSIQTNGSDGPGTMKIQSGQTLGSDAAPATVYVFGTVNVKSGIDVKGTIVFHGDGLDGTGDLDFQGPHTLTAVGPACATCAYPLVVLGYNPNEGLPSDTTQPDFNLSNNNVHFVGVVYSGGTVDLGPNTVDGSLLAYKVNANNGATEYRYTPAYEGVVPPPGFSTPAVTLPSVIARGTWLHCRTADNLTDPCD